MRPFAHSCVSPIFGEVAAYYTIFWATVRRPTKPDRHGQRGYGLFKAGNSAATNSASAVFQSGVR